MIPQTVDCQAPQSKEFSWQEYWSGLPFSCPGDLLDLGIKPRFPALQADFFFFFFLPSEPPGKPWGSQDVTLFGNRVLVGIIIKMRSLG